MCSQCVPFRNRKIWSSTLWVGGFLGHHGRISDGRTAALSKSVWDEDPDLSTTPFIALPNSIRRRQDWTNSSFENHLNILNPPKPKRERGGRGWSVNAEPTKIGAAHSNAEAIMIAVGVCAIREELWDTTWHVSGENKRCGCWRCERLRCLETVIISRHLIWRSSMCSFFAIGASCAWSMAAQTHLFWPLMLSRTLNKTVCPKCLHSMDAIWRLSKSLAITLL